jgi:hypothetical protein
MPTKISLALGKRQPLSRQTAWGCFTTNLALPGFGSLVAGHVTGYAQALLAVGGLALTLIFGAQFLGWYVANWSRLQGAQIDPIEALAELWRAARWPFLGIGVFALGWLWALTTSWQILRSAKQTESANAPPRLS